MNDRLAVFFDSCVFEHATLEGVMNRTASLPDPLAYMQEDTDGIDDFINRMRSSHEMAATTGE